MYKKRFNPLSEKDLVDYFHGSSVQNMRMQAELNDITEMVANIGKNPGDDPYDEAGQVINTISRKAGERINSAIEKFDSGNIGGGMADVSIASFMLYIAGFLKIAFP
jgi:hypothetical protein